uniref:Putative serine/threonine protein kinase n=1 Tax=Marseillevirus LCMAC201 TaxID=2506605 RepID=A0A481YW31_9VIRU|nr:MAG: putative serine/threonine protein kinase [Marseillevirus LCMAC201]
MTGRTKQEPITQNYGKYRYVKHLSQGSFGRVVLATVRCEAASTLFAKRTDPSYALKIIPSKFNTTNEINILKDIQYIHGVVQYIDMFKIENNVVIVTEFCKGQELFNYINNEGPLSEKTTKYIFKQLCIAIQIVHTKGIVHRDLKPENIIINDQYIVTIIDWGFAFYPSKTTERESCGSPNYAAPEILVKNIQYGSEVDVWSLGCILYAMLTGLLPFDNDNISEIFNSIVACSVDYDNTKLSEEAIDLLRSIFTMDNRITITEILNDRWLNPDICIDWH